MGSPSKDQGETTWVVIGTVAGIVGALAALAVFFFPSYDFRAEHRESPVGTAEQSNTSPTSSVPPATSTTAAAVNPTEVRRLTDLTMRTGSGLVAISGQNISVPCPTNNSDDTAVEFSYRLPSAFAQFATTVSVTGKADRDATAGIQMFTGFRDDRSDRFVEVGRSVVSSAKSSPTTVEIDGAVGLTLRVTCTSRNQTLHLSDPRLTR